MTNFYSPNKNSMTELTPIRNQEKKLLYSWWKERKSLLKGTTISFRKKGQKGWSKMMPVYLLLSKWDWCAPRHGLLCQEYKKFLINIKSLLINGDQTLISMYKSPKAIETGILLLIDQDAAVLFYELIKIFFISSLNLSKNFDCCLVQRNGSCCMIGTFFLKHKQYIFFMFAIGKVYLSL